MPSDVPSPLPALLRLGTAAGLQDRVLLERFTSRVGVDDEAAEAAFAALVDRHGPMVLRTCRAVLGDRDRAEDAFQATFLVLASRAGVVRRDGSLGAWLHGVALRVAACSRSREARRRRHERRYAEMAGPTEAREGRRPFDDTDAVLHDEVGRLPEKYRAVVVACYLQGLTHEQAADLLGWPVGTVRRRLAWARDRMRPRLVRRGAAPADGPPLPTSPVPLALAEAAVRGASYAALGKSVPAGVVSARVLILLEGVLKAMATRPMLLKATLLAAGLATAGSGAAVYSARAVDGPAARIADAPRQQVTQPPARPRPAPPPPPGLTPSEKEMMPRVSVERVRNLIRDFDAQFASARDAERAAKTPEEQQATWRRANPAALAGALLYEAEMVPGTPAAEEALFWIASSLTPSSILETVHEVIARDHAKSDRIGAILRPSLSDQVGSRAAERLLREILDKNPKREIRASACFLLARFLDRQAFVARHLRIYEPSQLGEFGMPIQKEAWGRDYAERMYRLDPVVAEREAATLYERASDEFGDVRPLLPPAAATVPGYPRTIGEMARSDLRELRELAVGRTAPEIEGVDLDDKPMKLSDYRGKVVILYFCSAHELSVFEGPSPTRGSDKVRAIAERHAGEPLAVLGVSTVGFDRHVDREAFKKQLQDSRLPARFWWDNGPDSARGPIQTAWNTWRTSSGLYVLDRRGVIRFKGGFGRGDLLEYHVANLLDEREAEAGRPSAKD